MISKERKSRKMRTRARLAGRVDSPRLVVFRSNKFIYAQLVDDNKGVTVAAASGIDPKVVGGEIAKEAVKGKVSKIVFDRSGYKYHGKVKLLAEAAREGGLKF